MSADVPSSGADQQLAMVDELAVLEGVTAALQLLAEACRADRAYVTLYAEDGTFANTHEWTRDEVLPQLPAIQSLAKSDFAWSVGYAERQENLIVDDLDDLPAAADPERSSFGTFGVKAVLQIPIVASGQVLGVVGFNRLTIGEPWQPSIIERTRALAGALGVLLFRTHSLRRQADALAAAEHANRAKDELLARVSHELRTPLHAILGYAELLGIGDSSGRESASEAVEQIASNGRWLLSMVEDLLEVSRLAQHEPHVETSLADIVADTLSHLSTSARARQIELRPMPTDADREIVVDVTRLRQIIHCSLSAAMTAVGTHGWISVKARAQGGDAAVVIEYDGPNRQGAQGLGIPLAETLLESLDGRLDRVETPGSAGWIRVWVPQPARP